MNIITMSERDWTIVLTEDCITMNLNPTTSTKEFIPCKAELATQPQIGNYHGTSAGSKESPQTWLPFYGRCSITFSVPRRDYTGWVLPPLPPASSVSKLLGL